MKTLIDKEAAAGTLRFFIYSVMLNPIVSDKTYEIKILFTKFGCAFEIGYGTKINYIP